MMMERKPSPSKTRSRARKMRRGWKNVFVEIFATFLVVGAIDDEESRNRPLIEKLVVASSEHNESFG